MMKTLLEVHLSACFSDGIQVFLVYRLFDPLSELCDVREEMRVEVHLG